HDFLGEFGEDPALGVGRYLLMFSFPLCTHQCLLCITVIVNPVSGIRAAWSRCPATTPPLSATGPDPLRYQPREYHWRQTHRQRNRSLRCWRTLSGFRSATPAPRLYRDCPRLCSSRCRFPAPRLPRPGSSAISPTCSPPSCSSS